MSTRFTHPRQPCRAYLFDFVDNECVQVILDDMVVHRDHSHLRKELIQTSHPREHPGIAFPTAIDVFASGWRVFFSLRSNSLTVLQNASSGKNTYRRCGITTAHIATGGIK